MTSPALTPDRNREAKTICDEICEWLETHAQNLNEDRGKPASSLDEVWDEALRMVQRRLHAVGGTAQREGAQVTVRKR